MRISNRMEAKVLGIPADHIASLLAWSDLVESGLPFESLQRLCDTVAPDNSGFCDMIIPRSTYYRRRRQQRLYPRESFRI